MDRCDPKPEKTLTTSGGVTVVVHAAPPPPPPPPPPEPPRPTVVIRPPGPTGFDRDAVAAEIAGELGPLIRRALARRSDLAAESARDIQQRVLMIACAKVERDGRPENLAGFVRGVVRNEIANHKRAFRPAVDHAAEADAEPSPAPDPEQATAFAELRAKLARYLGAIPAALAEVVRRVDLDGLTIDQAAADLGRPRGTISRQLARARDRLFDLARASERRTRMGRRR